MVDVAEVYSVEIITPEIIIAAAQINAAIAAASVEDGGFVLDPPKIYIFFIITLLYTYTYNLVK